MWRHVWLVASISSAARTPLEPATAARLTALICLIDNDRAPLQGRVIQLLNSSLRILIVTHLHKAKTFAPPGFAINDHRRRDDLSHTSKKISKILAGCLIGKFPYVQFHGVCSHSDVTPCIAVGGNIFSLSDTLII